jgi:hypothetical protein
VQPMALRDEMRIKYWIAPIFAFKLLQ